MARETVKRKPIVIFKAGRTDAGSRATMSHTGSMAGSDEIFDSVCRQVGLIRVQEALHLFDLADALAMQPIPQGKRVAILGSGGQGVVAADACSAMGLEVPELDGDTVRSLMEGLPPHAPVPRNPVDFAGSVRTAKAEAAVVEKLLSRDYIDGVISNVPVNPQVWAAMSGFTTMKKPLLDMTRTAMEGAEYLGLPAGEVRQADHHGPFPPVAQ